MIDITNNNELTKHESVTVYLKNCPTAKVALPGKVVSVATDNTTVIITTDQTNATFDTNDVVSVVFGKHTATAAN